LTVSTVVKNVTEWEASHVRISASDIQNMFLIVQMLRQSECDQVARNPAN